MIFTEYHIKLYKQVGGDVDHLQRIGTLEEKSLGNQNIIVLMEEIVADLELVKNGMASNQYTQKLSNKLKRICANDNVIAQIKQLESFR